YWLIRRTELRLADLYKTNGIYSYSGGWNLRGLISILAGAALAVGGAYTTSGTPGPFPAGGLIGVFKPLYDYSWVVGFFVAFVLYFILMVVFPAERGEPTPAAAPATSSKQSGARDRPRGRSHSLREETPW